jgi:hypothetical protein
VVPAAGLAAAGVAALDLLRTVDVPASHADHRGRAPFRLWNAARSRRSRHSRTSRPEVEPLEVDAQWRAVREPRDPMLEVITDQPAILKALWVRVGPGITVDSTEPPGLYQAPKLEVAPIEVSPISKFVVPDTRAPIGVTPFILR